jgi:2-hydroxychromene-2-carboxylate isomerase
MTRAAQRAGLDPDGAIAAAYSPGMIGRIAAIRAEAEHAGVRGVPSILTPDGQTHWGMGGLQRLREGQPLVPRPA